MKRKAKSLSVDELYKQSDFFRRFSQGLARDLKDHRYPAQFGLDENKRYNDDPLQDKYLIERRGDEEYLVFMLSLVKIAIPLDEAKFFKGQQINLELRVDSIDSFSKVDSFAMSMFANLAMCVVFLSIMYFLFPILRNTVFAFRQKGIINEAKDKKEVKRNN